MRISNDKITIDVSNPNGETKESEDAKKRLDVTESADLRVIYRGAIQRKIDIYTALKEVGYIKNPYIELGI
jgi:hypothetical protein